MSKQFAEFDGDDGVDHRREIMRLFQAVGREAGEYADCWRAAFLASLVHLYSRTCFLTLPCNITPCSAVEAYVLLVKITSALGVPMGEATRALEDRVRHLKDFVLQNKVTA